MSYVWDARGKLPEQSSGPNYHGSPLAHQALIIEGGTIVDPKTGGAVEDGVLVLDGGKVAGVGSRDATRKAVATVAIVVDSDPWPMPQHWRRSAWSWPREPWGATASSPAALGATLMRPHPPARTNRKGQEMVDLPKTNNARWSCLRPDDLLLGHLHTVGQRAGCGCGGGTDVHGLRPGSTGNHTGCTIAAGTSGSPSASLRDGCSICFRCSCRVIGVVPASPCPTRRRAILVAAVALTVLHVS